MLPSRSSSFLDVLPVVYRKELRGLLRDRHTLLYSVVVPAFLYPVLLLGMLQIFTHIRGIEEKRVSRVVIGEDLDRGEVHRFFSRPVDDEEQRWTVAAGSSRVDLQSARTSLLDGAEEEADAILVARVREAGRERGALGEALTALDVDLFFTSTREASLKARERLSRGIEALREEKLRTAATILGVDDGFLEPVAVEETSLSTPEEVSNFLAGLILPLLMIFMTALGAFYPALEATVGERERGTLETTLLSPVSRLTIVAGKYLAVTTLALFSFALNFGSMSFTLLHLQTQLPVSSFTVSFHALWTIAVAAVLLAGFFSAWMMLFAFLARSFKEGQSYVTPIYLISILPVMITSNPEASLTPALSLVPVINIALLFRDSLVGALQPLCVTLTLGSSAVYACVSLLLAARLLNRESIATGAGISPARALRMMWSRGDAG